MNNCIKSKKLFLKALYNEIDEIEKKWFARHLSDCEKCTHEYEQMSSALEIMNSREVPEQGDEYWDTYWLKLSKRIDKYEKRETLFDRLKDRILENLAFRPILVYAPVTILFFMMIGIFLDRQYFSDVQNLEDSSMPGTIQVSPFLLNEKIDSYLERSKIILTTISNFNTVDDDIYTLDIPGQREVSRKLIQDAEFIQSASDIRKHAELLKLVFDLQMILLKIVEIDEVVDGFEIELIKTSIENSALLLKINLEQIRKLTDRQQTGRELSGRRSSS
ncbi:hypothetical protein ACFL6G_02230 [candidate division KSB1 bacterium]